MSVYDAIERSRMIRNKRYSRKSRFPSRLEAEILIGFYPKAGKAKLGRSGSENWGHGPVRHRPLGQSYRGECIEGRVSAKYKARLV